MTTYVLNDAGEPVPEPSVATWAAWMQTGNRQVASDSVGAVRVSTVFLGVDHAFDGGPPVLWETMCFDGTKDRQRRYTSKQEAIRGHVETVAEEFRAQQGVAS
jgi:hypothetical protein